MWATLRTGREGETDFEPVKSVVWSVLAFVKV